ncbi:g1512 [Coccomyxa viridis]|uniref:G1512 protein n=1 Tax=Coccomyxa viridis TaxID=1274662 RepID=A0ABP1FNL6_9CHLO
MTWTGPGYPSLIQSCTCIRPSAPFRHNGLGRNATRRSATAPAAFFSAFRKKRDDNGKTKERIAQEDISNNTVGVTGSTAGQAVAVLQEVESSTPGNKVQIVFERQADIRPEALAELIEQVGWPKRKLAKLETALKGSYLVSAVLKRELREDATIVSEQLIGLIRCTSDRVFNATIWDVLVSPEFQGRGIGRNMVARTVEYLKEEQIGNICLFADADAVGFYQQLGFRADPDGVRGMFWNQ